MIVREERAGEAGALSALTTRAFAGAPHASGKEAAILERLRADGDLLLSLVAEDGGPVGHAAFSPATVGGQAGWAALGPISVAPGRQRQGVGRALVAEGLRRLSPDRRGVVLLGDPAVYGRMGFVSDGGMHWRDVPPEYLQFRTFGGPSPRGEVEFARAFDV